MRDPKRIDRILDKLKVLWKLYPDYRFGQMLINNFFCDDRLIWHLEDDVFEKAIDMTLKKAIKEQKRFERKMAKKK